MSATDSTDAARGLRAEVFIDASTRRVWDVLTDFSAMIEGSPELMKLVPLRPGGLRRGQQYLGINRRRFVVWPTRNVIVDVQPEHRLAWDTTSSGARWSYELAPEGSGTRLSVRRCVPKRLTMISRVFATGLLGGTAQHADELESALDVTLAAIRSAAEKNAE